MYQPSLEKGLDQLIVTLYTLSIYPSVHKQLIWTLFEEHIVLQDTELYVIVMYCNMLYCTDLKLSLWW